MIQKGKAVQDWQKSLSEAGYNPGPADGVWGQRTSEATKSFQTDNGFPPDGKVTADVLRAMEEKLAGRQLPEQRISAGPFYKKPLFWVAVTGAALVGFTMWRDNE